MSDSVDLVARITGPLVRRYSTATVLYHHAIAERLGLGPSDHKCLDLLVERGTVGARAHCRHSRGLRRAAERLGRAGRRLRHRAT